MNRWWILSAAVLLLPSAAYGGSYKVVLEPGGGKMLVGHAGVQAVDDRTATALVRVISPGMRSTSGARYACWSRTLARSRSNLAPNR